MNTPTFLLLFRAIGAARRQFLCELVVLPALAADMQVVPARVAEIAAQPITAPDIQVSALASFALATQGVQRSHVESLPSLGANIAAVPANRAAINLETTHP